MHVPSTHKSSTWQLLPVESQPESQLASMLEKRAFRLMWQLWLASSTVTQEGPWDWWIEKVRVTDRRSDAHKTLTCPLLFEHYSSTSSYSIEIPFNPAKSCVIIAKSPLHHIDVDVPTQLFFHHTPSDLLCFTQPSAVAITLQSQRIRFSRDVTLHHYVTLSNFSSFYPPLSFLPCSH